MRGAIGVATRTARAVHGNGACWLYVIAGPSNFRKFYHSVAFDLLARVARPTWLSIMGIASVAGRKQGTTFTSIRGFSMLIDTPTCDVMGRPRTAK